MRSLQLIAISFSETKTFVSIPKEQENEFGGESVMPRPFLRVTTIRTRNTGERDCPLRVIRVVLTADLPRLADILGVRWHVSKVPKAVIIANYYRLATGGVVRGRAH
jgi:hypothetical protein